jgi:hypothetical protein
MSIAPRNKGCLPSFKLNSHTPLHTNKKGFIQVMYLTKCQLTEPPSEQIHLEEGFKSVTSDEEH